MSTPLFSQSPSFGLMFEANAPNVAEPLNAAEQFSQVMPESTTPAIHSGFATRHADPTKD